MRWDVSCHGQKSPKKLNFYDSRDTSFVEGVFLFSSFERKRKLTSLILSAILPDSESSSRIGQRQLFSQVARHDSALSWRWLSVWCGNKLLLHDFICISWPIQYPSPTTESNRYSGALLAPAYLSRTLNKGKQKRKWKHRKHIVQNKGNNNSDSVLAQHWLAGVNTYSFQQPDVVPDICVLVPYLNPSA